MRTLFCCVSLFMLLFFASCSGVSVDDSEVCSDADCVTLKLGTVSDSRTVYPDSWTGSGSALSDFHFVVSAYTVSSTDTSDTTATGSYYRDSSDSSLLYTEYSYSALKAGSVSLKLSPDIWRITLSAYQSGITASSDGSVSNTDLVLTDTEYINLKSKSTSRTLSFALTAPSSSSVTGTLSVALEFYPPDTFNSLEYTLYAYDAETATLGSLVATASYSASSDVFTSEATGVTGFSYSYYVTDGITLSVTGGSYLLVIAFEDINGMYIARYPLSCVIAGGATTTADIVLHRAVFNSSPLNCSALSVDTLSWNGVSVESGASLSEKAGSGMYQILKQDDSVSLAETFTATFSWKDNATNESGYYVQAYCSVSGASWTAYGSRVTLSAGAASYTADFPTGARYKIAVKPYNSYSNESGTAVSGYDTYVESDSFGIFTVIYNLFDADDEACTVKITTGVSTDSGTDSAFVFPYLYGDDDYNDVLSVTSSHPYIAPPTDCATGYSLSWQDGTGSTLSDLGGYTGENMTLTPVWTQ